ncbi:MAG TPA: oligosaccharide flippase family protein [Thermoplasmata archaeon]|nr:oligosaccharide flippase family protein [Thermoplasmata archaeon]
MPTREPLSRRLFMGSAYALLATIVGQGLALLTSIVYARVLGDHDLGVLAIYSQLASLAVAFASVSLGTPITRFVAKLRGESPLKLEKFIATVFVVILSATVLVSVGLLLFALSGGLGIYRSPELVVMIELTSAFLVLNSLAGVGAAVLQGLQRIRRLSIVGIVSEALTVPVMFISLSAFGLIGAALGGIVLVAFSTAALFGSSWRDLRREGVRFRLSIDREAAGSLVIYALPLLLSGFFVRGALFLQSSFLALDLGFADAGLFRVASTITRVIALVPGAISIPLLPALTELYATSTAERARKNLTTIIRIAVLVGVPLSLAIGFLARPIIVVLYGASYRNATTLAFVLVMAAFVDIVNAIATNSLLGEGRTRELLSLDIGQSILVVLGTVVFVQWFGLLGVGYAALLASLAFGAAILVLLGRRGRVDLRRVASPLAFAGGGFALATVAVVALGALTNYGLGALLALVSLGASWILLQRDERKLLVGLVRSIFHRAPHSR